MARKWTLLMAGAALAVGRAEMAEDHRDQDHVSVYKAVAGECVQTSVAGEFQGALAALAGLRPGACRSEGFDEAKGSRDIAVPALGQLRVELFGKSDLLGLVAGAGAQALGLQGPSPCCRACAPGSARHYSIDTASGRCTETCVAHGAAYWLLKALEPNLTRADGQSCSTLGFPAYNTTLTRGIPPASFSRDVYGPPLKGSVVLSKVVAGICGQAIVGEESEAQVARATGLERGYCLERGYTEAAGGKTAEVPVLGTVHLALYRRTGELDLVDAVRVSLSLLGAEMVTLYKITDGLCGQATIDKKFQKPAMAFAGLQEGDCKSQGYAKPAGNKDLHVPYLGDIKIRLYKHGVQQQMALDGRAGERGLVGAEMVTLYKIADGLCGQATLDKKFQKPAMAFAGLQEGQCKDHGYTKPAGNKELHVPYLGDIKIELYKQDGVQQTALDSSTGERGLVDALRVSLSLVGAEMVTLYKIADGLCGQATLDKKFQKPATAFAGLLEGTCKDHGYTKPAGDKELHVPYLGDIKIELYRNDAASQIIV